MLLAHGVHTIHLTSWDFIPMTHLFAFLFGLLAGVSITFISAMLVVASDSDDALENIRIGSVVPDFIEDRHDDDAFLG